jgi:hypothetical protein
VTPFFADAGRNTYQRLCSKTAHDEIETQARVGFLSGVAPCNANSDTT